MSRSTTSPTASSTRTSGPRAGGSGTRPGPRSRPADLGDRFAARFLIPGGLWLVLFFAIPLAIVLALSFGVPGDLGGAVYGWHPENYSRVFDPLFVPVLLRSCFACGSSVGGGGGRGVVFCFPCCSPPGSYIPSGGWGGPTSTC